MSDIVNRLQEGVKGGAVDRDLLEESIREIAQLRQRRDALEEILIILARTGLPWDEAGAPNDAFPAFRERYRRAMHEAAELLGLERSTITRTEPRT